VARKKRLKNLPKLIFQDQCLLVLSKPPGWVTLYGSGKKTALQDWLEKEITFKKGGGLFKRRSGIVHRLDKDTSGLLLVAKDEKNFTLLQELFKKRLIKKEYLALVKGEIPTQGTINAPIKRRREEKNKWRVFPEGRESITHYFREKIYFYQGQYYSLIKVKPSTGRTHQIRVHFQYLGFPLVGDPLYSWGSEKDGLDRLFLHASQLEFKHPESGKRLLFQSGLTYRLEKHLKMLEKKG